jgi:hypothetical protein
MDEFALMMSGLTLGLIVAAALQSSKSFYFFTGVLALICAALYGAATSPELINAKHWLVLIWLVAASILFYRAAFSSKA